MKFKKIIAILLISCLALALLCSCSSDKNEENQTSKIESLDDLEGKKVGVQSGSFFDQVAEKHIKNPKLEYIKTLPDNAMALNTGKVDAYICDEPVFRMLVKEYPNQKNLANIQDDAYGFVFPKTEEGKKLRDQFNEFLTKINEDGTIKEIDSIWFGDDEDAKKIDFGSLTGENGTLKFATDSSTVPFSYVKDGQHAGYEIDLVFRFCKEYGYGIEISDSVLDGVIASVSSSKSDFGAACISITEERKESMYFSDPDYVGGVLVIINDANVQTNSGSITESFRKTFINEDRWKLFVGGIGITLLITVTSVIVGTIIGFLLYLVYRRKNKIFNTPLNILIDIFEKTPIVVILMILYYIIFGKSDLEGMWVASIGFSLLFAFGFIRTIDVGVGAVDSGQIEASLALGFTDMKAFIYVVLPQAIKHFMPVYRGKVVSLIKDTAIVGYIAVEDLTKVSDIVRSRTYEAFFPLIATAIIYFALAWLLTLLVKRIEIKFDSKKRSEKKILKGMKIK